MAKSTTVPWTQTFNPTTGQWENPGAPSSNAPATAQPPVLKPKPGPIPYTQTQLQQLHLWYQTHPDANPIHEAMYGQGTPEAAASRQRAQQAALGWWLDIRQDPWRRSYQGRYKPFNPRETEYNTDIHAPTSPAYIPPYVQNYWDNPYRVARAKHYLDSLPPGTPPPEWMDPQQINTAYEYLKFANNDRPWWSWDYLPETDPGREYLAQLPPPPDDWLGEGEGIYAQASQTETPETPVTPVDLGGMTQEEYDNLPLINKIVIGLMGNATYSGAAMGALVGLQAGPVGVIPGAILGTTLGGYAQQQQKSLEAQVQAGSLTPAQATQPQGFMKWMMYLDYPAELLERSVGTLNLLGLGALGRVEEKFTGRTDLPTDVLENLRAAWQASHLTFEMAKTSTTTWEPSQQAPRILTADQVGYQGLVEVYRRLKEGKDAPEVIYQDVIAQMGFEGQMREMMGHIFADPLNFFGLAAVKGLEAALKLAKVSPKLLETIPALARMTRNVTLMEALAQSTGTVEAAQKYANFLRNGVYEVRTAEELAHLPALTRFIAGIDKAGKLKNFTPLGKPGPLNKLAGMLVTGGLGSAVGFGIVGGLANGNPALAWTGAGLGAVAGTALLGGGRGLSYLFHLTPESQAVEVVEGASLNIGMVMQRAIDEDSIKRFGHMMADNSQELAAELGMRTIESPAAGAVPMVIRDYLPQLDEHVQAYKDNAWARTMLDNIAKTTESDPALVLKDLKDVKNADTLLEQYVNRARQSNLPEAKAIVDDYEIGELTGAKLKSMAKTFLEDHAPLNFEHFQNQVMDGLLEHASKWAVGYYNVQPDPLFIRLSQTVKQFQSLLLLGINPNYLINNAINNFFTMAARGVLGFRTPRQIDAFWKRVGYIPPRLYAGLGAAAAGHEVPLYAIREAKIQEGLLANLDRFFARASDKLAFATKYAAQIEQASSAQAYTSAMAQSYARIWKPSFYGDLPETLAGALSRIDPGLPDAVRSAIASGMNKTEIESALWSGLARKSVDAFIPDAAREVGIDEDAARELLRQTGVYDFVQERMKGDVTDAELRNIMQEAAQIAQDAIEESLRQAIQGEVEQAKAKASTEGLLGAYQVHDQMEWDYIEQWYKHAAKMDEVFKAAADIEDPAARAAYIGEGIRQDRLTWERQNLNAQAQIAGVMEALGVESEASRRTLGHMIDFHDAWKRFYDLRDTTAYRAQVKEITWNDFREIMAEAYEKAFIESEAAFDAMDGELIAAYGQFGAGATESATAWRAGVKNVRAAMHQMMSDYRAKQDKPWTTFWQDDYIPAMARLLDENRRGAAALFRVASGEEPPPVPPAPEMPQLPRVDWQQGGSDLTAGREAQAARQAAVQAPAPSEIEGAARVVEEIPSPERIRTNLRSIAQPFGVTADRHIMNVVHKYGGEGAAAITRLEEVDPEVLKRSLAAMMESDKHNRRVNTDLRMEIDALKRENAALEQELRQDPLMGIKLYERNHETIDPAPYKAAWDIQGLGFVNDHFGREAGNTLLRAQAQAAKDVGIDPMRAGGDEMVAGFQSEAEANAKIQQLNETLAKAIIIVETPEGRRAQITGLPIYYGTGPTVNDAYAGVNVGKAARTTPKGTQPAGMDVRWLDDLPTREQDIGGGPTQPPALPETEGPAGRAPAAPRAPGEQTGAAAVPAEPARRRPEEIIRDAVYANRDELQNLIKESPDLAETLRQANKIGHAASNAELDKLPPEVREKFYETLGLMSGELDYAEPGRRIFSGNEVVGSIESSYPDWYAKVASNTYYDKQGKLVKGVEAIQAAIGDILSGNVRKRTAIVNKLVNIALEGYDIPQDLSKGNPARHIPGIEESDAWLKAIGMPLDEMKMANLLDGIKRRAQEGFIFADDFNAWNQEVTDVLERIYTWVGIDNEPSPDLMQRVLDVQDFLQQRLDDLNTKGFDQVINEIYPESKPGPAAQAILDELHKNDAINQAAQEIQQIERIQARYQDYKDQVDRYANGLPTGDVRRMAEVSFTRIFGVPEEQAKSVLAVYDAVARSWASRNHRPVSEWWDRHIAGFALSTPEGEAYYQLEMEAVRNAREMFASRVLYPDWIESAIKEFGLTNNAREAGYILPDGRMLDFSGSRQGELRGARYMDHREITRGYEYDPGADHIAEFSAGTGAVRMSRIGDVLYLDIYGPLTREQIDVLEYIPADTLVYDISNAKGYRLTSGELPDYEPSDLRTVANFVRNIFEGQNEVRLPTRLFQRSSAAGPVWYSQLTHTVQAIPQEKMTVEQLRAAIVKGGVKADEMKWTGLDDFLTERQGKITKAEVLDFLRDNEVRVDEVIRPRQDVTGYTLQYPDGSLYDLTFVTRQGAQEYLDSLHRQDLTVVPRQVNLWESRAKYGTYTLPNGWNYRELLLTLPVEGRKLTFEEWYARNYASEKGMDQRFIDLQRTRAEMEWKKLIAEDLVPRQLRAGYQSTHWDEPNVLVHVRFNDRVDADGKKMLFIEEVQSDWHEAGRKKGYKGKDFTELPPGYHVEQRYAGLFTVFDTENQPIASGVSETSAINTALKALAESSIPPAPFSNTWHELAMKRILRWAAEKGYDRIGWTTGDQQAARYNLARVYEEIQWKARPDGKVALYGRRPGEESFSFLAQPAVKDLPDYIGEEAAKKITDQFPTTTTWQGILSGENLTVGGSGMRGFYDEILPRWANKYGKKWNVGVIETQITVLGARERVHAMDVTPEMRVSVMQGQPLFQRRNPIVYQQAFEFYRPRIEQQIDARIASIRNQAADFLRARGFSEDVVRSAAYTSDNLVTLDPPDMPNYRDRETWRLWQEEITRARAELMSARKPYRVEPFDYYPPIEEVTAELPIDVRMLIQNGHSLDAILYADEVRVAELRQASQLTFDQLRELKELTEEIEQIQAFREAEALGKIKEISQVKPETRWRIVDREGNVKHVADTEDSALSFARANYADTFEITYVPAPAKRGDVTLYWHERPDGILSSYNGYYSIDPRQGKWVLSYPDRKKTVAFDTRALAMQAALDDANRIAQKSDTWARFMFQPSDTGAKGAVDFLDDGRAILYAMQSPDVSTLVHELAHIFRRDLDPSEMKVVTDWLLEEYGVQVGAKDGAFVNDRVIHVDATGRPSEQGEAIDIGRWAEEQYARAFERYLAEGMAPTEGLRKIFEDFKRWLLEIYSSLTGSEIDIPINDELKRQFDRILDNEAGKAMPPEQQILFQKRKVQQLRMFTKGEELPLFTGTPQEARESVFKPTEKAGQKSLFAMSPAMKGAKAEREVIGKFIYFKRNGELWRAPAGVPDDINGYPMGARWEAPAHLAEERLAELRRAEGLPPGRLFQTARKVLRRQEQMPGKWEMTENGARRVLSSDGESASVQSGDGGAEEVKLTGQDPTVQTDVPPGTVAQASAQPPMGRIQAESWDTHIWPILNRLERKLLSPDAKVRTSLKDAPIDAETRSQLESYLSTVYGRQSDAKIASMRYAEMRRDAALLNYSRRYGIDNATSVIFLYQFWYTRTALNWMLESLDYPAWVTNWARLREMQRKVTAQPGFPSRLLGKMRIPAPWLPKWAGGDLYFDPLHQVFPIEQIALPITQKEKTDDQLVRRVAYVLQSQLANEDITPSQAQEAARTQAGPVWEKAMAQARLEVEGEISNPFDFVSIITSPSLPITILSNIIKGTPEKITKLPVTNFIQSVTALAGIPGGVNIEAWLRRNMGLPEGGEFGDYYIDRMISNMAADGSITPDQALQAMADHQGSAYDEAVRRVGKIEAIRYFGKAFWLDFFPEGEKEQRRLQQEFSQVMDTGDPAKLNKFFQDNPEYRARLFLRNWDNPQEKLKQFLISEVWSRYRNLPDLYQKQVREQFGPVFQEQFLDKETRSYDSIDIPSLTLWTRVMNGYIPKNAPETPAINYDFATPEVASTYQAFVDQRDREFPGVFDLQNLYFGLPETERPRFLEQFPQLARYWEWADAQRAAHPEIIPYTIGEDNRVAEATPEIQALYYQYRATKAQYFPGIDNLQSKYFGLDTKKREAFRKKHPELVDYWEWQRSTLAQTPELIPYVKSIETIARDVLGENYIPPAEEQYTFDPRDFPSALVSQLMAAATGTNPELSAGARRYLHLIWENYGEPGNFEEWVAFVLSTFQRP